MGRIVVTEFVPLDGVMEAPGGEDFKYPGWTFEFDCGDDGNQFKLDEIVNADAHLAAGDLRRASPTRGRRAKARSPTGSTKTPSTSSHRPCPTRSGTTPRC